MDDHEKGGDSQMESAASRAHVRGLGGASIHESRKTIDLGFREFESCWEPGK